MEHEELHDQTRGLSHGRPTLLDRRRALTLVMKLALVMAASSLVAITVPAAAKADPGGPDGANFQAHFFDCTGPAGTPTSFDAESQYLGAAWHLTDSQQTFVGLIGFDETTNTQVIVTPGFLRNAVPAVTCRSVGVNGHVFRVTGVLTPATGE